MSKNLWTVINEGGDGYRPSKPVKRSRLMVECEISDEHRRINRWEFSSDLSAPSIIAKAKARIAELEAELATME